MKGLAFVFLAGILSAYAQTTADFAVFSSNANVLNDNWAANDTTAASASFNPTTTPDGSTPVAGSFNFQAQNNNNDLYIGAGLTLSGGLNSAHGNVTIRAGGVPVIAMGPTWMEVYGVVVVNGNMTVNGRGDFGIRPTIDAWQRATMQIGGAMGITWMFGSQYTPYCGTTCTTSDERIKRDIKKREGGCGSRRSEVLQSLISLAKDRSPVSPELELLTNCTSFGEKSTVARMRAAGRYSFKYAPGISDCDDCVHSGWMANELEKQFPETVGTVSDVDYVNSGDTKIIDTKKLLPHIWDAELDLDASAKSMVAATTKLMRERDAIIQQLTAEIQEHVAAVADLSTRMSALENLRRL